MANVSQNNMSGLDIVIYRPAKAIAFFISVALLVAYCPYSIVFIASGYVWYRILYYQRGWLYRQGISRWFVMGCLAIIPFLIAHFIDYDLTPAPWNWKFSLMGYLRDNAYFKNVNGWLFDHADQLLRWKSGTLFGTVYGVFLYVLNVELDNRSIRQTDLQGLKITQEALQNQCERWKLLFEACMMVTLVFYSVPLALLYLGYFLLTEALSLPIKRIVDGFALTVVLLIIVFDPNFMQIVAMPQTITAYLADHGMWELFKAEFRQMKEFQALSALLVLPLLIENIVNQSLVKSGVQQKEKPVQPTIQDGVFLGHDMEKKPVIVSDKEFNQHCLILGSTGSGKTTTIFNVVDSALSRGLPLIFLDGKGSKDLVQKFEVLCAKYGRKLRVFALDHGGINDLNGYNPFGSGNFTEWKNRVMSLFAMASGRGQEHFALAEENYVNLVCQVLAKTEQEIDLRVLLAFLENPNELLKLANRVDEQTAQKLAAAIEENREMTSDVIKLLEMFIYSHYGFLFDTAGKPSIKIKESIKNKDVVLFLFNASSYSSDTRKVAKMVISDINSSFAELANEQGFSKCYCIFDEFASYASENLSETISLHRSNGMHAIVGTQSIVTVSLKSEETKRIAEELIACCNTYIVQAINHTEDIELMAKTMGTKDAFEVTSQVNSREGGTTGMGTVKSVAEFVVNPQEIRDLSIGESFLYRKSIKKKAYKIKIHMLL